MRTLTIGIPLAAAIAILLWQTVVRHDGPVVKSPPSLSVLAIGWDGSRRQTVQHLLQEGRLPNLAALTTQGQWIDVTVREARTDTKAGWAQIFTGYSSDITRVRSNRDYAPIPPGLTAFERLKARYGAELRTLFISGKVNNIGARGPHQICANCRSRSDETRGKTGWWDENQDAPTKNGEPRQFESRDGEPFMNALRAIDVYKNGLGAGVTVMQTATEALQGVDRPFFAFVHFEEPDEPGHRFGEGSEPYIRSLIENDRHLGELRRLIARVPNCIVFVLSDHGFDEGRETHKDAPETFWVSSLKNLRGAADRRDFTPTLLELYGFNLENLHPQLSGRSLRE